jgi:flagellar motor switch protein FliG
MAQSQAQNSTDITSVIATLGARQGGKPREKIAGPKRAAMLMLALGEQYGGKIWQMLDDDEVRELSLVMSTLGTVEADVVEDMLLEFVSRMSASGALMGSCSNTCRRSGCTASWTKSAAPPAATCGRSSPTSRKRCSPTI